MYICISQVWCNIIDFGLNARNGLVQRKEETLSESRQICSCSGLGHFPRTRLTWNDVVRHLTTLNVACTQVIIWDDQRRKDIGELSFRYVHKSL
jgi:hypothetical protein